MTYGDLLAGLLAGLRKISWSNWDPIGLAKVAGRPDDEYDTYLLRVASILIAGHSPDEASGYLVQIEHDRMGLGERSDMRARAEATVAAVADLVNERVAN